jgi:hypothetical protein
MNIILTEQLRRARAKAGAKGGLISGPKNVETGLLEFAQRLGRHMRWHVRREIVNMKCLFCNPPKN